MRRSALFCFAMLAAVAMPAAVSAQVPESKALDVPYMSQVPQGRWVEPWSDACEEASLYMVDAFYRGTPASTTQGMTFMRKLFAFEDKAYGSNRDTDAARNLEMINRSTSFGGSVVQDPSLEAIKAEIDAGHPVIAMHYGKTLDNPDIPFARNGSYYHVTVVVGYDEARQEFLVNDPGDPAHGAQHRYAYAAYLASLHDYDYAKGRADGPARVIFTHPKLAKAAGQARIYFLGDGVKRYVANLAALARIASGWPIVSVESAWLSGLKQGAPLI